MFCKRKTIQFSFQLFILLLPLIGFSQVNSKYTISGYIIEKGSKENMPGASIYISRLKTGTISNNYGFYSITLPSDTFDIMISFVGYKSQYFKINLTSNIKLDVELENQSSLNEVVVSAENSDRVSDETQMSKIGLPVEQIKSLPALLGEKDVLKAIQLLPGVQKGSEGSSGIYVRGGGPDQNLIILDDATVYNASHLFGFFSLFNGDALKSVELTKGGFPARYGGRLSSVVEMQMKDGNKEKIHGEAGIGLLSSRLTLEGPIKKNKASFLISGRRTYIDFLLRPLIKATNDGNVVGYYFYDLNAKLNYVLDYKNKLYLSGYFGNDKFYLRSKDEGFGKINASLKWGNATGTLRWNHLINEKLFSNVSFIFSNFLFGIGIAQGSGSNFYNLNYSSGIRDYTIKADFDYYPTSKHTIKMGIIATYHRFVPNAVVVKSYDTPDLNKQLKINGYETAIYMEDDYKITDKWRMNAGFRLSNFNVRTTSYFNPEPRLSLRYALKKDISIKASYAYMNQYLHLLSNSGFGLPTDLWVPATDRISPQKSQQVALGLAKDMEIKNEKFLLSLEGYYKKSKSIIGYKEGSSFLNVGDFDLSNTTTAFSYEDIVTSGNAESYGMEFFIQKKTGKYNGWIGYTLSWTWLTFNELNFGNRFPARYDRRHDISIVNLYKLNDRINLSAVWVYGTGNAITLPLATYQLQNPSVANSNKNLQGYDNTYTANDYGARNSFRMSPYHRLDISIQFHKQKKKYERIFEVAFYNTYNRKNPFYYTTQRDAQTGIVKLKQISLFPILPSFTWTWKF